MKFCWCTIAVNNMEESLNFYQNIVGLTVDRRFKAGSEIEISFLGKGETKVELIYDSNHKANGNVEGVTLGFEVESIDNMITSLKGKGIESYSGPFQPNPTIKFIYVKDPNGVNIQFVENC